MKTAAIVLLALFTMMTISVIPSAAQPGGGADKIYFKTPLRPDIVFAYKITERLFAKHTRSGQVKDSSERIVTYFVSQRQTPVKDTVGLIRLEVNVDSMTIDFRSISGRIYFSTQKAPPPSLVRHREVFATSVLANRPVTFTVTSYGQVVRVESEGLSQVRAQALDSMVPIEPYARQRLLEVTDNQYLTALLLPGRGLLPLGRRLRYSDRITQVTTSPVDMIPFRDSLRMQLLPAQATAVAGETHPHLHFQSVAPRPLARRTTFSCFDAPLNITSAGARTFGDLFIEEDGVVASGLISTTCALTGTAGDDTVESALVQEVYIERLGMVKGPIN